MMVADRASERLDRIPVLSALARRPSPWFALAWAPLLLLGPVIDAVATTDLPRVIALAVLGSWFAVTVWLPYLGAGRPRWRSELAFAGFLALAAAYVGIWHTDEEFVFPLIAIAAAVAIRRHWALGMVGAAAISGATSTGFERNSLDAALFLGFSTYFAGVGTFLVRYLVDVVGELRRTREQLADAAVAAERLRFSRDLHDLLGHTLSVIVVKAEAIRRLVGSDPDAAATHAHDVETIGRRALADMRDAVTGYRSMRLADALSAARTALGAADIELEVAVPPDALDTQADALLGWVVREGTTNVLRHSGARRCRIVVTAGRGLARIEITDDGRGAATPEGDGLAGLRERLQSLGGEVSATSTDEGFRLAAAVPDRPSERGGR
ncbi:histidine kinase [Agromyces sp. NPDC049794]|uniref:sensor histidine kinase n=1 Tax=unclassified Agromyces TaxID=2639701 RepID=UPI0033F72C2A